MSKEKCPLQKYGLHWDTGVAGRDGIPAMCTDLCGDLIDAVTRETPVDTDLFVSDQELATADGVEYGGTSLQRGKGAGRLVAVLSVDLDGCDLFSEKYPPFNCPND